MEGETSKLSRASKICGTDYYKGIAEPYNQQKVEAINRQIIELPNFIKLLGTLDQENVIDLACGGGFYTKLIRQRTTGLVYGVDISIDMIEFAKKLCVEDQQDITYIVHDCSQLLDISQKFDVVTATFLLQYAENESMLLAFLKNIFDLLTPGGRLIGLNVNPFYPGEEMDTLKNDQISIVREHTGPFHNFEKIVVHDKVRDFALPAFFVSHTIFGKYFQQVGFENFEWIPMRIEENDKQNQELAGFLQGHHYPQIAFEAYKPIALKDMHTE